MKEQKDRYRQAKEELKRVQEDFRSLRERLQVKKLSDFRLIALPANKTPGSYILSKDSPNCKKLLVMNVLDGLILRQISFYLVPTILVEKSSF